MGHTLSTHTISRHPLNIENPIDTFSQCTLSTHPRKTSSQHILTTLNTHSQHNLLTSSQPTTPFFPGENPHLQSNWDDGEGYYKPRIGEMIGERYQTLGTVGKGVFSIVIKCQDMRAKEGESDRGN